MSKMKSRLGRGLSSLISVSDLPVEADAQLAPGLSAQGSVQQHPQGPAVLELALDAITPNPHQPRRSFNQAALEELAASLKSTGMIQPIIVRSMGEGRYELVAGERRWRAAQLAGLPTISAIARDVDRLTQAQMALIENIQREDLNPLDRAMAYRELIGQLGLSQGELAGRLGEDRSTVNHYLRLLELPAKLQDYIRDGRISLGHARVLLTIDNQAEQERIGELIVSQGLSIRNVERLLNTLSGKPLKAPKAPAASPAHLADLEKTLARSLGMRVQLKAGSVKGRGRVTIHYASLDQFDAFLSRLGITVEE